MIKLPPWHKYENQCIAMVRDRSKESALQKNVNNYNNYKIMNNIKCFAQKSFDNGDNFDKGFSIFKTVSPSPYLLFTAALTPSLKELQQPPVR